MRLVVHAPSSEVFMEKIWLKNYPANMPQDIDASQYGSLVALLDEAMRKYKDRVAFRCMGASLTYAELDQLSARVASWLQALTQGDSASLPIPIDAIQAFCTGYQAHARLEEAQVFPHAQRLPPDALAQVAAAMVARRTA